MKTLFLLFFILLLLSVSIPKIEKNSNLILDQEIPPQEPYLDRWIPYSYAETGKDPGRADYSSSEYENLIPENSCQCLAFRFDDVQNGWLTDVQQEVMAEFREKNIPLTIGIIGQKLEGNMATFVNQITNKDNSQIEIANHGWSHENFTRFDKQTQTQLMKKTNARIFEVTGKTVRIFVPPFNVLNEDTITAIKENNFTHYSSSVLHSKPPYPLTHADLYNFPETSTTGTITSGLNRFEGLSYKETMQDILASQKIFGFSVVTMHPQEFSILQDGNYTDKLNESQIQQLDLLIDQIQKSGIKIVFVSQINENVVDSQISSIAEFHVVKNPVKENSTFSKIKEYDYQLNQKIPEWVRNNAKWWAQDSIKDNDFITGIQFLINEGIMTIPETTKFEGSSELNEIPSWIKNNANWWSQNLITDDDFLNGIQYLIKNKIIVI